MRQAVAGFLLMVLASYPASERTARRSSGAAAASQKTSALPTPSKPSLPSDNRTAVQQWLRGMSLRDKIAQLVVIHSYGEAPSQRSRDWKRFVHAVRDLRVGGIVVVNRVVAGSVRNAEPYAMASFLNRMQRIATVPLLMAGDFERGASMRVSGTAKFPHLMAFGAADDPELTRKLGLATAQEARAMGIQWVFAPVADVNNNPENPIINIRSFGDNPDLVARHVRAFIEGAHSDPATRVLVTAKHFPGHGDTNVDSHIGLPVLGASRERMERMELVPFRAAAEAGVDAIMSAHMAVPAYDSQQTPATVSRPILTGIIREQLGYKGLIVTDAMDMAGLAKQFSAEEAAARAIEAGADVLLMPPDPDAAIRGVLKAVTSRRIQESRINESVVRVLDAKARVGLHKRKLVNLELISESLETDEHLQLAQTAADRAVTALRNEGSVVPLRDPVSACFWIMGESRFGQAGRRMLEELRSRVKGARLTMLDPQMSVADQGDLWSKAQGCSAHVAAAFISVAAYRGKLALSGSYADLMDRILKSGVPSVLVSLGNPYLGDAFPGVQSFVTTFSPAPTAEVAVVKALLGEIPMKSR